MKRGFIALTSVIIISSVLTLYIIIDSQVILYSQSNIERVQNLHQNFYNAESCENLKLISTPDDAGIILTIPDGSCTI